MKKEVDDYLQEGIYGTKEINPDERRMYLGSLRERVVLALSKGQVMQNKGVEELDRLMKENPGTKLLLNGNVSFRFFKQYRQIAIKNKVLYTTVNNREEETDYGAVLTYDHAVDIENILLKEETDPKPGPEPVQNEKENSFLSSLFGRFNKKQ